MKDQVSIFISKYYRLFDSIGLKNDYILYDYNTAYNNNGDFIDYECDVYKFGSCERGICQIIFQSHNIMDCMYFPIRAAIHNISFEYELNNRRACLDFRVLGFGMMLFYMNKFNTPQWSNKLYSELLPIIDSDKLPKKLIEKISKLGHC
ncbi:MULTISPECIES: hypothetical protein [unclassified Acinetobacter]|uniref:hypothetical protein n=1 Tax=unclassified Acinetobacter TaxID=196816 RepID=UPI0029347320|nr:MULTISPECIES: hypothetical protein [unclassified Acinetobacter]WOE32001.1 hypothetical protein QSG84_01880 [Acinetobacter sp. SAAs470]WOE37469.1 hypothetical protein QSG86_10925 [Acinetobacter sp. SAAs474]